MTVITFKMFMTNLHSVLDTVRDVEVEPENNLQYD